MVYSKWSPIQTIEGQGPSECWQRIRAVAHRELSDVRTGFDHPVVRARDDTSKAMAQELRLALGDAEAEVTQIAGTDDEGQKVLVWYAISRQAPWRVVWTSMPTT